MSAVPMDVPADGVQGVELGPESVWIGAGTTHAAIRGSRLIREHVPLLALATSVIGPPGVPDRATIGGSIAHAGAAAGYAAVALALDAEFETNSPRGSRIVEATDYFAGPSATVLADDEFLTGMVVPRRYDRAGYAVEEFRRSGGDSAKAGAAVVVWIDAYGRVDHCAIALFGLAPSVVRALGAELTVVGRHVGDICPEEVAAESIWAASGFGDQRGRTGAVVVARAWRRAVRDALYPRGASRLPLVDTRDQRCAYLRQLPASTDSVTPVT